MATLMEALSAEDGNGDPVWPSRVAAAKTLLSRAGFGEQAKLIVQSEDDNIDSLDKNALADQLESVTAELRRRSQRANVEVHQSSANVLTTHDNGATWHQQQ